MKRRLSAKDVESLENTSIGGVLGLLDVGTAVGVYPGFVCVGHTSPPCRQDTTIGVPCPVASVCGETAPCTVVVCPDTCADTCCAHSDVIRPLEP